MTEVLSSSRDPDRSPRHVPRPLLVLAAVLLAATGLIGYVATRSSPPPRPTAAPVQAPSPDPPAPVSLQCGQLCDDPVLKAGSGTGPRGLRLLINTSPLKVLGATGKSVSGPRIPLGAGEHVESLLPMGAGAVALVQANFIAEPAPLGKVYRLNANAPATLIGRADSIIQGIGSTVWTVSNDLLDAAHSGSYTLRELDQAGHELTRQIHPPEIQVLRATRAGLLATVSPATSDGSYYGAGMKVVILNAAQGSVERVLSKGVFAVLDVTDTRVAWSSTRRSVIEVYDLEPGTLQAIPNTPAYHAPDYGRFSPDQHSLVLGYTGTPQIGDNPATYGYLQVLGLRTGHTTTITGLLLPPKRAAELDWSRDASTVILGVDGRYQVKIAFWTTGTGMLTVLATTVAHSDSYRFTYLQPST